MARRQRYHKDFINDFGQERVCASRRNHSPNACQLRIEPLQSEQRLRRHLITIKTVSQQGQLQMCYSFTVNLHELASIEVLT